MSKDERAEKERIRTDRVHPRPETRPKNPILERTPGNLSARS